MSRSHPREKSSSITLLSVDIETAFRQSGLELHWRAVSIKHALKEFAGTLSSCLAELHQPDDRGEVVHCAASEQQLLALIPGLLSEATRLEHLALIREAVQQLALGRPVDLLPLLKSAIADLAAVQCEILSPNAASCPRCTDTGEET